MPACRSGRHVLRGGVISPRPSNDKTKEPLVEAHRVLGTSLFYLGEFVLARTHFEQGVALEITMVPKRAFPWRQAR
jgi:hypothetical protein